MVELTDATIRRANRRGREYMRSHPVAQRARYDSANDRIIVDLQNGCTFAFPPRLVQGLECASPEQLGRVEIDSGIGLHWSELDVDYSVAGLMAGIFGTRSYMASRAGSATSPAKVAAARANGRLGGRPRKTG